MKKVSAFGYALLFTLSGLFFSGCSWDDLWSGDDDGGGIDCGEVFCVGTLLADSEDFNKHLREAITLAEEDINKAGGNIEIVSGDSFAAGENEAGEHEVTGSAVGLSETGVHGIVGPSYSSDSLEIIDNFLDEEEIVIVSPSATSPTITDRNEPFFFRVSPSDLFQAPIIAKQTKGSVVIVNRGDEWGEGLAKLVKEHVENAGRNVLEVVNYDPASFDAARVVADVEAIAGIGTAGSIVALVFDEGGEIIKGLLDSTEVNPDAGYYVGDGLVINESLFPLVNEEDGDVEGFVNVTSSPRPGKRLEEFKERFSDNAEVIGDYAAHAYDAVVILRLAALSAESSDPSDYVSEVGNVTKQGTKCYSYATCAAALTDETTVNDDIDYEGISGPIDFNDKGDITDGVYSIYTYDERGKRSVTIVDFNGNEVN